MRLDVWTRELLPTLGCVTHRRDHPLPDDDAAGSAKSLTSAHYPCALQSSMKNAASIALRREARTPHQVISDSSATPTGNLSMIGGDGGRIDTATLDAGAGGDINLSAGSMRLDGQGAGIDDTDGHPATRISTSTLVSLEGAKAGDIVIKANSVDVATTAEISSTTLGPSPAGHIEIDASNELAVVNGGQINTANLDAGAGGDITLTAGSMRLDGQGAVDESGLPTTKITTLTAIEGRPPKPGDIVIKAGSVDITNSAQISSDTLGSGSAGRIEIDASSVRLDGANANFTQIESQTIAEGNAGDIILNADSVDIRNTAQIVSSTLAA